jgi:hypothetical protein
MADVKAAKALLAALKRSNLSRDWGPVLIESEPGSSLLF